MLINRIPLALAAASLLALTWPVHAETPRQERREEFRERHPRRAEVNQRLHNQRRQLRKDLKSGKITQDQYNSEVSKLNSIKKEEVTDVKSNGGYLTKDQQKDLNKDLNETKKDIREVQGGTPPPPPEKK